MDYDRTKIRARRLALGLTIDQTAYGSGITASTWGRIERGVIEKPHKITIKTMLEYLGKMERRQKRQGGG